MQSVIIEGIGTIARCGQHTPQNIDLMSAMLSALKKKDIPEELLLNAILVVSSYSCYVQSGRHYPDILVKTLMDESISPNRPARSRAILLAILQKLVKTQKKHFESVKSVDNDDEQEIQKTNMVLASLSKKQQKELHYCLFKTSLLKDNEPQNYVRIYRTLRTLVKRYRNDVVESVPMILTLQDATNDMDRVQARAIHTLCAAYFLLLGQAYNNKELEKYVQSVIDTRLNSNQINANFMTLLSQLNAVSNHSSFVSVDNVIISIDQNDRQSLDRHQLKRQREDLYGKLEQLFGDAQVPVEHLFNRDEVIELLSRIESLKTGDDFAQSLSRTYTGDMNVSQIIKESDDEPRWDIMDEQTEPSMHEPGADVTTDITAERVVDVIKTDFVKMGDYATALNQESNKTLDEILALVPLSEGDHDHSLLSETEEDEDIMGEEGEMVSEKGKQKGRVMQNVPKLYLFD
jgi:hypothetical protein